MHMTLASCLNMTMLEKFEIKLKKAQNKCPCFCLNLLQKSLTEPSHFRKTSWLPVSDRVLQIPFLSTGMVLYRNIFLKCLSLHSSNILQEYRWHLDSAANKYRGKCLSFGPKMWSKIYLSTKIAKQQILLCIIMINITISFLIATRFSCYH